MSTQPPRRLGPASIEVVTWTPERGDEYERHATITVRGVGDQLDNAGFGEDEILLGAVHVAGRLARVALLLEDELRAQALEHRCDPHVREDTCGWDAAGMTMDDGWGWCPALFLYVPRNRVRTWTARIAEVLAHLERTDQPGHYRLEAEPPTADHLRLVSGT